jgi:N-acetylglutamate synthase-like GNAT family acetyltransferase
MIEYRKATPEDSLQLVELLSEIMQHHGVIVPQRQTLESVVHAALESPYHSFVVAAEDDAIVGMCGLIFTYSTWSAALVCELQDVIVCETKRRSHIGSGLLQAAENIARDQGCARLFLLAEAWNFGAHSFYRSLVLAEKTCLYFERDLSGG